MPSDNGHHIDLPDGRVVAVDDRGPAAGPVVVLLHSAPGSRRLDPDPEATAAAGVRLITIDRPGYGGSSPLAEGVVPTITQFADDTAAVLHGLGIGEAAIVGWSAGGRVALAIAARHPDRVRSVAMVATPAPDDEVPWVPDEYRAMSLAMRDDPAAGVVTLTETFAPMAQDPATAIGAVGGGPADDAVVARPEPRARLVGMLEEAFRRGAGGLAADIVSYAVVPWGFDPAAVGASVALFYGDQDPVISPDHGRYWHGVVADADLTVVAGAGHLVPFTAWADILAAAT